MIHFHPEAFSSCDPSDAHLEEQLAKYSLTRELGKLAQIGSCICGLCGSATTTYNTILKDSANELIGSDFSLSSSASGILETDSDDLDGEEIKVSGSSQLVPWKGK
jgi:hypothetical protein